MAEYTLINCPTFWDHLSLPLSMVDQRRTFPDCRRDFHRQTSTFRLCSSQRSGKCGNTAMQITIDISPGELLDRLSILEIKIERLEDPLKRERAHRERERLDQLRQQAIPDSAPLRELAADLKAVNTRLWETEDDIRAHVQRGDFGASFIDLARAVYHNNDRRAAIKQRIESLMNSALGEVKSYV